ncbi:hypothetical protein SAMN05446037_1001399 [Anaerovirgula multivorans]|uniref:Uncharacterized protein n=1 Tax=Anaerovirgula multivorans TaxID=312168 RepID=A0A239A7T8_9FIRM|nr:hypothetical protein [Anaerovirgula multivorans]SNR91630.1 hypothetical protein SAMN05446037_1001399 [Anaerovirgula multivorans]
MTESSLIERVANKNVNIYEFVEVVINDENIREEIIKQLLTNNRIMVYYHCYYIISKASEEKPKLFYKYWDDFASLLNHKNSYHRDIGLTIIANLTKVDEKDLFSILYEQYIKHFNDTKFMTAQCFVQNLKKIIKHKSEYIERVVELLLEVENRCNYLQKQKELLKSDIIEVLDEAYQQIKHQNIIEEFIRSQSNSISPKTKKKAKEFLKKHKL